MKTLLHLAVFDMLFKGGDVCEIRAGLTSNIHSIIFPLVHRK